jgi:tRNA (guanine10-N2)-dimethyltransferase
MLATGLSVKKSIKSSGRPVRLVPNPELALNSAQVLHNQLTAERAWELVFVRDGTQTIVAQTTNVQDIDAYAARDQARPARDARVGMLPPKLAQIIMNLATSTVKPNVSQTLLDPFCGTGVVLQEAVLAGYNVYGTDLEERMIRYSRDNLNWLQDKQHTSYEWFLEVGDATSHTWRQPVDTIAGETYLGRPFSALPKPDMLQEVMQDVNLIHKKFLRNVARQTQPGFRLCIAVPAWKTPQGFKHLKTLEILPELGYTRMEFAHASTNQLIYHRENQIVGRELVVLVRK